MLSKIKNHSILLFILWTFITRIPHFFLSEFRFDADGAHHWYIMELMLRGEKFLIHPVGMNHIGITEFILAFPFVPFVGHTMLAYQLGLCVEYILLALSLYYLVKAFGYKKDIENWVLILFLLPNPFYLLMTLNPYGGHIFGPTLAIFGINEFLKSINFEEISKRIYKRKVFISGILFGLAAYTNRLSLIIIFSFLLLIIPFLYKNSLNKKQYILYHFLGGLIGILPIIYIFLFEPKSTYETSKFTLNINQIIDNINSFFIGMVWHLYDLAYFKNAFDKTGFLPDSGMRNLIFGWQKFLFILSLPLLPLYFYTLYKYIFHKNKLTLPILSGTIILVNIFAIIFSNNSGMKTGLLSSFKSPDTYGDPNIRYLLPAMILFTSLFVLLASGELKISDLSLFSAINPKYLIKIDKVLQRGYIIIHIIIFSFSYIRGYLPNSPMYAKSETTRSIEVYNYLKENKIKNCITQYWLGSNILYYSKLEIIAGDIEWPGLINRNDPFLNSKIINNPKGIECFVQSTFDLNLSFPDFDEKSINREINYNNRLYKFDIAVKHIHKIGSWVILLTEENEKSINRRLNSK